MPNNQYTRRRKYAEAQQAKIAKLKARVAELTAALRAHHEWHQGLGEIGLTKDDKGEWIEVDMSLEYSDSPLCDQTMKALASDGSRVQAVVDAALIKAAIKKLNQYAATYEKGGVALGAYEACSEARKLLRKFLAALGEADDG